MRPVGNPLAAFHRSAANPPAWMRLLYIPVFTLLAFGIASRRGWLIGVIAGVCYGAIAVPMTISPGGVVQWSRRHPVLDGAFLGPLVFLAAIYFTRWPWWGCLLVGLGGVVLGALAGRRRARRGAVGPSRSSGLA